MKKQSQQEHWKRLFWSATYAAGSIGVLGPMALLLSRHGAGAWSAVPIFVSVFPIWWLWDKAIFNSNT